MRMVKVTDRIPSLGNVYGFVGHHLYVLPVEQAFFLLGHHIRNPSLPGVEVIADLLHSVGAARFGHGRLAFEFSGQCIQSTFGIDSSGLHVVLHVVGGQFDVAIFHGNVPVVENLALAVGEDLAHRVLRPGERRRVEGTLFLEGY